MGWIGGSAMDAPKTGESTREERSAYVSKRFPCLSDCDLCGNCATFHGREPLLAFADYVAGREEFGDVLARYRRR